MASNGNRHWKIFAPAAAGFFAAGALAYLYALREAQRYGCDKLKLPLEQEHHLRILHLSDLHLKQNDFAKLDFLREITGQDYDLVFLTGDIFEDHGSIAHASALLKRMPRLGAYAVLGNHDLFYYNWFNKTIGRFMKRRRNLPGRDVAPAIAGLEKAGYIVLRDKLVQVPNQRLSILGIDYPYIAETKLRNLLEPVAEGDLLIALFHLPYNLDLLNQVGVHLAFGGHTHGGQVRIPGYGAIFTDSELSSREASGLIWRGSTAIHISRGLGADPRTNFRLFCPPAVTVIDVVPATAPVMVPGQN
jgi:uncharacterized protein